MVLHNSKAKIVFPQYGIQIPSLDTRKTNTVKALKDDPFLGPRSDEWFLQDLPDTIGREDLERAHTKDYLDRLFGEEQEKTLIEAYELIDSKGNYNRYDPESAEAPLSGIIQDVLTIISGSYMVIKHAMNRGFAFFLGGGMHHGHPNFGHGFCLLNDVAVAVLRAKDEGLFRKAWIVDIDAHRGDGTAEIMADHPDIKTVSIHMAKGWPLDSPKYLDNGDLNPSWFPGDVDIPIESGEEGEYTSRLISALDDLEQDGRPDFIYVVAGVDPYEKDELPSSAPMRMTKEQMLERDQNLYRWISEREIPSAWVSAGGYGASSWEIHTQFLDWVLKKRLKH